MNAIRRAIGPAPLAAVLILSGCAAMESTNSPPATAAPVVAAAVPAPVPKLPRKPGKPVTVTIYEFRSGVSEIAAGASTDMFITALVKDGTFQVVERAQFTQSLVAEKQLNGQGLTTGKNASKKLLGVDYIFEGSISEANAAERQSAGSVGVAGMSVSRGATRDVIAIDVRIVDAATGQVRDAVTVKREIRTKSSGIAGVGSFVGSLLSRKGADPTLAPDVNVQTQRKASVDEALRAAIADSVAQLAARF